MESLIITPKTKIFQLLESYPQLEDILIQYAPAFKKLKNPILRNTVAKVTTLQQAAVVGHVKVEDLINRLRKEVGQDSFLDKVPVKYITKKPDWFFEENVVSELNAKEMLAVGEHPVNQVMADLKSLRAGQIYKLIAPFLPAPLIDKSLSLGVKHWIEELDAQDFNVYFYKSGNK